jgi:phosphohistidine phosphatase
VGSIYLLRHAKSSWDDPGLADHDRPLAPRGVRNASSLAAHIRAEEIAPELVLCSSALRTRETLAAILGAFDHELVAEIEDDLYGASATVLLERLRSVPETVGSVMLVGHNPGLEELAAMLAVGEAPERMPTSALVALSTTAQWPDLAEGSCHLESVTIPR